MITPIGPNSTIYRATFANGQQAHVIPITTAGNGNNQNGGTVKNFRPITPSASHIYMEIDPVYNSETLSDILVSDLSDDDVRRSSGEEGSVRVGNMQSMGYNNVSAGGNHHDLNSMPLRRGELNHTPLSIHSDYNTLGDYSGPVSTTYTGTGQQLLRLDLGNNSHPHSHNNQGGGQYIHQSNVSGQLTRPFHRSQNNVFQ
jgi:hypothetical protein